MGRRLVLTRRRTRRAALALLPGLFGLPGMSRRRLPVSRALALSGIRRVLGLGAVRRCGRVPSIPSASSGFRVGRVRRPGGRRPGLVIRHVTVHHVGGRRRCGTRATYTATEAGQQVADSRHQQGRNDAGGRRGGRDSESDHPDGGDTLRCHDTSDEAGPTSAPGLQLRDRNRGTECGLSHGVDDPGLALELFGHGRTTSCRDESPHVGRAGHRLGRKGAVPDAVGRCAVDLALTIPTQHLDRAPNSVLTALFATLTLSSVVIAVVVGQPAIILGCLAMAVVAGGLGLLHLRRSRPLSKPRPTSAGWW